MGTGTHSVTGTFVPTSNHAASNGSFALTVSLPSFFLMIRLPPRSPLFPSTTLFRSCTATVTDTSASPSTPTGSVSFASDGTGTFSPGTSCNLLAGAAGDRKSVVYGKSVDLGGRRIIIKNTFVPTSNHAASNGAFALTVSPPAAAPTSTVVSCVPGSVPVNSGCVCTAAVSDTSASPSTPTGSVSFASDGTGTFSPGTSCNLLAGAAGTASCAVTYTPTVVGTRSEAHTSELQPTPHHASRHRALTLTVSPP